MHTAQQTIDSLKKLGASPRALARVLRAIKTDGTPGANFYVEAQKAAARLAAPKVSELERAERVVARAARLLDRIVAGDLLDNGTDGDRLAAESIKRHGPGIVVSFIRLGVDVFKVHKFYTGDSRNGNELE